MSKYGIAVFLILYGATSLITTYVPPWLVGLVALAAGLTSIVESIKPPKP